MKHGLIFHFTTIILSMLCQQVVFSIPFDTKAFTTFSNSVTKSNINIPRGGNNNDEDIKHGGNNNHDTINKTTFLGVLDLRAEITNPISILQDDDVKDPLVDFVVLPNGSVAIFPSNDKDDNDDVDVFHQEETKYDSVTAAAETIGTTCNSICLLVTYENESKEQTVQLHRHAGMKLASFINGIHQRMLQQKHPQKTKLTLVLFISQSKQQQQQQAAGEALVDTSSAVGLVDRLRKYYEMTSSDGSDDTKNNDYDILQEDPFDQVEIISVTVENINNKETVQAIIKRLSQEVMSSDSKETARLFLETLYRNIETSGSSGIQFVESFP